MTPYYGALTMRGCLIVPRIALRATFLMVNGGQIRRILQFRLISSFRRLTMVRQFN